MCYFIILPELLIILFIKDFKIIVYHHGIIHQYRLQDNNKHVFYYNIFIDCHHNKQ